MSNFKKGDTKVFLDYQIIYCTNGDGIVLKKHPKRPQEGYETHLGNYSTLDDAQQSAVIYFMLARPENFATSIFHKVMGSGGSYHEFFTMKQVLKDEGIEMPEEITAIDGINFIIGYKGNAITFAGKIVVYDEDMDGIATTEFKEFDKTKDAIAFYQQHVETSKDVMLCSVLQRRKHQHGAVSIQGEESF